MKTARLTGLALAVSAASLFSTACSAADEMTTEKGTVKCEHSTACKGQGKCGTDSNSCAGHNACKGKGWTEQKSDADCKAAQDAAKKA